MDVTVAMLAEHKCLSTGEHINQDQTWCVKHRGICRETHGTRYLGSSWVPITIQPPVNNYKPLIKKKKKTQD